MLAFCGFPFSFPDLHKVPPLRDCSKIPAILSGYSCSALLLLPPRGLENLQQCPPASATANGSSAHLIALAWTPAPPMTRPLHTFGGRLTRDCNRPTLS